MYSGQSPSLSSNFSKCKYSAWIPVLLLFLMGFVFQGCVVHHGDHRGHNRHSRSVTTPAPIVFTFTKHHRRTAQNFYHRHPRHHGKKHAWKKTWRHKRKSHLHTRIQMQTLPFDLRRQLPPAPRGTQYIYVDDQLLLVNVKTRVILDFINIQVPVNQNTYNRKPAPRNVDRMPSYQEQHPSQTHQPPSQARAYEVSQGKPFTEDEHPSSNRQGHRADKGKPYTRDDHPSSHGQNNQGQDHRMDKGKPDMREDHPSQHAKNDRGHGQQADRGKPEQGQGHSSRPSQGNPQGDRKGGPPEDKGRPTDHAQMDKGNRGGSQQGDHGPQGGRKGGPPKGHDRPSKGKGKPTIDSPMESDSGSHQMNAKGKPDKGKPKGKGKTAMDSPMESDSQSHQMESRGKSDKGKPDGKGKQKNRDSARGPSGQKGGEQFQPDSTPEENVQVSRVEKDRGKGKPKGSGNSSKKMREEFNQEPAPSMAPMEQESPSQPDQTQQENIQIAKVEKGRGKGNKMNRGKRQQQTDRTAPATQQEPAPTMAPPEPVTTASIAPSTFDSNQRSIIQSYYQNSGSKKSGKGRGKKSRGSKRNKTASVSKNDILTQSTEPLPRRLESQLPPTSPNTRRTVYNQQVLLVENGTNRILDVINVNN
jgi:Ni/Co efflux regulator RcnB